MNKHCCEMSDCEYDFPEFYIDEDGDEYIIGDTYYKVFADEDGDRYYTRKHRRIYLEQDITNYGGMDFNPLDPDLYPGLW